MMTYFFFFFNITKSAEKQPTRQSSQYKLLGLQIIMFNIFSVSSHNHLLVHFYWNCIFRTIFESAQSDDIQY